MSIPRNPFAILEGSELSAQHAASNPTHNTLDARHSRHKYQYISYGRQTVRQESHKQRHSPLWQPQAEDAIGPSFPSALATARIIEDIESVQYPEGIMGPKWNLNANTKNSKFKYDRDFLLQFMPVCKEKPDRLPPLDAIGLQPHYPLGLGIGNFPKPGSSSSIGKFATTGVTGKSSEERFAVANRAASVGRRGGMGGAAAVMGTKTRSINRESTEWAERKVETLLTMLTWQNFDSISDQIIRWANRSETEKDGRTLIQVIRQVFKQATAEEAWSGMYAHLCRKMMEKISASVQDDGTKNNEGKPIAGGQLFLEYLVKRCHEEFERGWATKDVAADVTATKAGEDETIRAVDDMIKDGGDEPYSEEYYAASKARHQGLGLIKFIGELFKMQMLTERIMHECLKKLLANVENPEEEGIESLCMLLQIVGVFLDTSRARARMDVYFSRMKELARSGTVTSRMQIMLQDVFELRDRKWKTLDVVATPNLAAVHDAANRVRAAAERESAQRMNSMSLTGSRRGGVRGQYDQQGPDGWTVTGESGGRGTPRPPPKAGDLSNFGTINKAPMTFGPTSVFAKGKEGTKGPRMAAHSRPILSWDALSRLSRNSEIAADARGPKPTSSRPASRKTNLDQDSMEFFSVRDLDEAEHYFQKLTPEHRCHLVDKLVKTAIESKAADAQLVGNFFARAHSKNLCSEASFAAGFMPTAELLDDIVIDAPKAFDLMVIMMKGASLSEDARDRIAAKSVDSDKLLALTAGSQRARMVVVAPHVPLPRRATFPTLARSTRPRP
ncbi:ARM repeat-containing protein [Athelia psychrophila]|uniref:ARM repeat-containing protein n=1 Tax=Athelia psychrophila TaxID=1759441 RepID=A0A166SPB8_9AGAM|nr:ARM repeat-containing protein [Fibularhizoctonia sp. CBS 109695]